MLLIVVCSGSWLFVVVWSNVPPKHIVSNISYKTINLWYPADPNNDGRWWLLSCIPISPKNNISSCISPILYLLPLSTWDVLLFGLPLQVIMIGSGVIPFFPNQQQCHCGRIVFNCSILLCLSPSQWQWHDCNGGAANGISGATRLIVVFE